MNPETDPTHAEPAPAPAPAPARFDTARARVMFALGFVFLVVAAGYFHRAMSKDATDVELTILYAGLLVLWPVFVLEAWWGVWRRDRSKPRRPVVLRALLVCLMPPWRMALTDPRFGLIWVPRIGWQPPGRVLFKRLDLAFGGPILVFAFLILPVLVLEYVADDEVRASPALRLALDIGVGVIWVAFATEFVFKGSAHPKPWRFVTTHWLDAAIVVLPMLEFVLHHWVEAAPVARLLRLGRAASPEYLARMQQLYRLRGLATKGWQALLVVQAAARLLGVTPEKRLTSLEEKIGEMEEDLADLRKDAEVLREMVAERAAARAAAAAAAGQNQPVAAAGGGTGEPSGEVATASRRPSGP